MFNNKLIFLAGASGQVEFWHPLITTLPQYYTVQTITYPGFNHTPAHPDVYDFQSLQDYVLNEIQTEAVLIAQSMGGIFAVAKTLQHPHLVKGLVLIATSGGIDLSSFNIQDWRTGYKGMFPDHPHWFSTTLVNYEEYLKDINIPVLLIWGDRDLISPPTVGEYLQSKLKNADLRIVHGGEHDLAKQYCVEVSQYIQQFLEKLEA